MYSKSKACIKKGYDVWCNFSWVHKWIMYQYIRYIMANHKLWIEFTYYVSPAISHRSLVSSIWCYNLFYEVNIFQLCSRSRTVLLPTTCISYNALNVIKRSNFTQRWLTRSIFKASLICLDVLQTKYVFPVLHLLLQKLLQQLNEVGPSYHDKFWIWKIREDIK